MAGVTTVTWGLCLRFIALKLPPSLPPPLDNPARSRRTFYMHIYSPVQSMAVQVCSAPSPPLSFLMGWCVLCSGTNTTVLLVFWPGNSGKSYIHQRPELVTQFLVPQHNTHQPKGAGSANFVMTFTPHACFGAVELCLALFMLCPKSRCFADASVIVATASSPRRE